MGKYAHYFHNGHQQVYDMDMWERAHNELSKEFPGFEFMGAIEDKRSEEEKQKWGPIPKVINNVGRLNKTEFLRAFGSSKLMVGLGAPTLSPSPYQALAKVSISMRVSPPTSQDLTPGRAVCQPPRPPEGRQK